MGDLGIAIPRSDNLCLGVSYNFEIVGSKICFYAYLLILI